MALQSIIDKIHPLIGTKILKKWDFPTELVAVPESYLNFSRDTGVEKADYADIVMVANLQTYIGKENSSP